MTKPADPAAVPDKPETLAEAIKAISAAVERLTRSGINRKGIVALVADDTKLSKRMITDVLDSLDSLAKHYTR